MNTVARSFRKISPIVVLSALSVAAGVAIVFLAQRLNFGLLLLLVATVPAGLYALSVLPLAGLKIRRLLGQLRWWHLLWLMVFLSGLTFRVRETESIQENPFDPAAIFRVALMGAVGLILLGVFSLRRHLGVINNLFRGLVGWVTAYAVISVLSTLWSVYPPWTLYKSVEYLITVALIAGVVGSVRSTRDFKALFDWTWLLHGLLLFSVLMSIAIWPEYSIRSIPGGLGFLIMGVFPMIAHEGIGQTAAILAVVSLNRLFSYQHSKRFYRAMFLISLSFMVLAQSRSAILAFFISIIVLFFMRRKSYNLVVIFILGIFSLLILFLSNLPQYLLEFYMRGQSAEQFMMLSDRVIYWQISFSYILSSLKSFFMGYGAYTGGRFLVSTFFDEIVFSSTHNTWVETALGVGLVGLIPLTVAVFKTGRILARRSMIGLYYPDFLGDVLRREALCVLAILAVRSMFQVMFIWHPALTWLLVLGYAEFLRRHHANRAHP